LRLVVEVVDQLVDIYNGTIENKHGKKKNCKNVNSPKHKHITEVLDALALFCEWREEALKTRKDSNLFIPYTSFDDLCSMVFGLVGVAQTYLRDDGSPTMVQRRGSTHVLEHVFGHLRDRERNFTIKDGRQGVAAEAAICQNTIGGNNRNAPHEGYSLEQLYEPMPAVKKN
jgi:hypothetical protein